MNKQMALSVLVKLVDRLTGPLQRITGRIQGLTALTGRISAMTARVAGLAGRIGAIGAIGAGLSFVGPLKAAADFDAVVRDIGITVGLSGQKLERMIATTTPALQATALEVHEASMKLGEALQALVASGLDELTAKGLIEIIGRVATASGAGVLDVARSAFSLTSMLKVAVGEMEEALGMLVTAGKLGRFEFRDMARHLPELAAGVRKFGLSGMEAVSTLGAALQVAMFGASDPSVAANNLANLFQKAFTKETIKNFEAAGVDIIGVMHNAVVRGINPFEAFMAKLLKIAGVSTEEVRKIYDAAKVGGAGEIEALEKVRQHIESIGGAAKIQRVIGDKQALDFITPFIAFVDRYREFKDEIGKADTGIIATDFASRVAGLTAPLERFQEVGAQAARRVGRAFATNLGTVNAGLEKLLASIKAFDALFPGWADSAIAWGGSLLLATAALGAFGQAVAFVGGGLAALGIAAGGWVAALVVGAAAIGAAALVVLSEWQPVQDLFEGISKAIDRAFTIPGWVKQMFSGGSKASIEMPPPPSAAAGAKGYVPLAAPEQKVGGRIVVSVEGPGRVTRAESENRHVPLVPDRGLMLGVP